MEKINQKSFSGKYSERIFRANLNTVHSEKKQISPYDALIDKVFNVFHILRGQNQRKSVENIPFFQPAK